MAILRLWRVLGVPWYTYKYIMARGSTWADFWGAPKVPEFVLGMPGTPKYHQYPKNGHAESILEKLLTFFTVLFDITDLDLRIL
jgi:hypothetical protein